MKTSKKESELVKETEELRLRIKDLEKKTEYLHANECRFKDIAENAGEWLWEVDSEGKYTYASSIVKKMLGYDSKEVLGKYFYDFFHPDDREEQKEAALQIFAKKKSFNEFFNRNIHKNGKTVWFLTNGVPILSDKGKLLGYKGSDIDLTMRKEIEQKLQESRDEFKLIFENAADAIFLADSTTGIIIRCNKAAERLLEKGREEILNHHQTTLHPPKQSEDYAKRFKKRISSKKDIDEEAEIVTKTGKIKPVHITASITSVGGKQIIQGIFRDITERKQLEQSERKEAEQLKKACRELEEARSMLLQAEKMNLIGQLASGVAHEVRNPLAIITQGINYLEKKFSSEENIIEILVMMKENIKRADKIIGNVIDFSRKTELDIEPHPITSVLEKALALTTYNMEMDSVRVIKKFENNLPAVLIDRGKMEQVFVNIFLNAIQAMPKGGNLFVRAYLKVMSEPGHKTGKRGADFFNVGEPVVTVEIEDTGSGIPDEYQQKVFEPFFSTKTPRDGTGLGLSISMNIIAMHKGLIDIKSEEGKGTKVVLRLKTQ